MTTNAHTCAGCPMCIPELSPDYWRRRAHAAEELVDAQQEHIKTQYVRIAELQNEIDRLTNELSKFWA